MGLPLRVCVGVIPTTGSQYEAGRLLPKAGTLIVGSKGTIMNDRIIPLAKMKDYKKPPKTMPRSPRHHQEWLNACRGGEAAGSNFAIAGPLTETAHLGSVLLYAGKNILWDPESMRITYAGNRCSCHFDEGRLAVTSCNCLNALDYDND